MLSVCPYFHVHQPYRIRQYRVFDIGNDRNYFVDQTDGSNLNNEWVLRKVANKCYLPATAVLQELLEEYPDFRFSFSFSGTVLEQFEEHMPDVLDAFKRLVATGRVELLADTHYHSLAFFRSRPEFERQVKEHRRTIHRIFGVYPRVFRHTELAYTNDLGKWADENGYLGIMAEGWEPVLGWRSPNFVYRPAGARNTKLLLKNYKLSDDVAFRFSNQGWESWPLSAETYADWISSHHGSGQTINLFMDFETLGEHQWAETGIFDFLKAFPREVLRHPENTFKTPSETIRAYDAMDEIDVPHILTWADMERDLSAWMGNEIQHAALDAVYALEDDVLASGDPQLIKDWRRLQTSDHFYYMCTKWFSDGDVHKYFNPYETPYDAHISYMNILQDMELRLDEQKRNKRRFIAPLKALQSLVQGARPGSSAPLPS